LIPIDKEIESLQNYLELEQLRNDQKFEFSISKNEAIEDDVALPPLLVQPFVENAILHGVIPSDKKGIIKISFDIENESLVCRVEDNGVGILKSLEANSKSLRAHKSMATEVTKKRLQMIASTTKQKSNLQLIELYDEAGKPCGTRATLLLPLQYV
jgi:LytS/YehU family sensor histidine kinase